MQGTGDVYLASLAQGISGPPTTKLVQLGACQGSGGGGCPNPSSDASSSQQGTLGAVIFLPCFPEWWLRGEDLAALPAKQTGSMSLDLQLPTPQAPAPAGSMLLASATTEGDASPSIFVSTSAGGGQGSGGGTPLAVVVAPAAVCVALAAAVAGATWVVVTRRRRAARQADGGGGSLLPTCQPAAVPTSPHSP